MVVILSLAITATMRVHSADAAEAVVRCTVIADAETGATLHREGGCDQRFTPMSSFKLPLAVMGFDSGILTDAHNPAWALKPEFNASAREQAFPTVDPTLWEKQSIVWYSQQLTRSLGTKRFQDYVRRFDYGNQDVSGAPAKADGLTHAWLGTSLAISPDEQVAFLRRFFDRKLGVSDTAYAMTESVVPNFEAADGWSVHGKTGAGRLPATAGKPDGDRRTIGWFVGWAEKGGRRVVFARMEAGAKPTDEPASIRARDGLIQALPALVR
ncbi:class D beta-lactamase [Mangrovicella endophytica]|uniref:class D beta-lactamase n=1 Tax=Mangrovicella endophytica TaxID=2066697 RepID=UPI003CC9388C